MVVWDDYRRHVEAVAEACGQCVWLHDENGLPLVELPPLVEMVARGSRNQPQEIEVTVPACDGRGVVHPVVDELIAGGLGVVDPVSGQLRPVGESCRLIVVHRPGARSCFRVTHATARGENPTAPETITIYGVDELDFLAAVPCPSIPGSWGKEAFKDFPRDEGAVFSKELRLRPIELATRADGFVVAGMADATIRDLITRSLQALWDVLDPPVVDDPPIVVDQTLTGVPSPRVLIRPQDDSILGTVSQVAAHAGVVLTARLWLPGDAQPGQMLLKKPTIVIAVKQIARGV